jgi:hypothetical protein
MNEMSGACGADGEESGVYRVLGGTRGKKAFGQTQTRLEYNINIDLQEVGGIVGTGWS